jgi:hypothetical protein
MANIAAGTGLGESQGLLFRQKQLADDLLQSRFAFTIDKRTEGGADLTLEASQGCRTFLASLHRQTQRQVRIMGAK